MSATHPLPHIEYTSLDQTAVTTPLMTSNAPPSATDSSIETESPQPNSNAATDELREKTSDVIIQMDISAVEALPRACSHVSLASRQSSEGGDQCRICHCETPAPDESGDHEPMITPCACAGSLKYVHQSCLQQWIKSADTRSCELCKYNFHMTTKIKPFRKWKYLQMSSMERRRLMCSVMFHAIAIACVVWSLYVLIERTTEEIHSGSLEWPFWTRLVVVAIGLTGGLVFMYIQCKIYGQLCRRWRAFNRIVYVQNAPPLRRSSAVTAATVAQTIDDDETPSKHGDKQRGVDVVVQEVEL